MSSQGDTDGPATTIREFNGVVGFVDLAGFTAATERLGRLGPRGAEILQLLINDLFTPAIDLVHAAGGEVGWFAGDAMGVVFDSVVTSGADAVATMRAVSAAIDAVPAVQTDDGPTTLAVKIGVAAGPVRWVTLNGPRLLAWFAGPAVDGSADAEHLADPGDVIVHRSVASELSGLSVDDRHVRFGADPTPPPPISDVPLVARRDLRHQPTRIARLAEAGDAALLDQHRPVTSMFVRFPETTHDPAVLAEVRDVVEGLGGLVQSATEGDKGALALALFGVPTALADRTRRTVVAAERIRAFLPAAAIGVASGRVFAGRVGSERRWDYSLVGDRVNTAARLMQAAAPGEVLIDEATRVSVGSGLGVGASRSLTLKGKVDVEIAFPVDSIAGNVVADDTGAFVGRVDELDALVLAMAEPGLTLLTAAAGTGKSRLLQRVVSAAPGRSLAVAIDPGDRSRPFQFWRRVLAAVFDVEVAGLASAVRTQFDGDERLPLLAGVTGTPMVPTPFTMALGPDDRTEVLGGLLVDLLTQADVGATVVVEDLHWGDESSLDLLRRVVGRLRSNDVRWVATARPEAAVAAIAEDQATDLHDLAPLDGVAMAELAGVLWREQFGVSPSPSLQEMLVEQAGGNPLFCEQLVAHARSGGVRPDADSLPTDGPDSLTDLLLDRLDALPEAASTVASYAAVFGTEFTAEDLTRSFGRRPGSERILGGLEILRDEQMVSGVHQYRFMHSLLSEAAYERLSFGARADLHLAVVEMLEEVRPDDVDELARHSVPIDDDDRKRRYFRLAGDRARDAFAQATARRWYRELVGLLSGVEAARVEARLGEIEAMVGDLSLAREHFEMARTGLEADERLDVELGLAAVLVQRGEADNAFALLDSARSATRESGDWTTHHAVLETAADLATMLGDVDRAEELEDYHRDLVRDLGSDHPASREIRPLAPLHWLRGDLAAARVAYARLHAEFLDDGDLATAAAVAADLAGISSEEGRIDETFSWLDRAREIFERIGHERAVVRQIRGNETDLRREIGDFEGARRLGLATALDAINLGDLDTLGHLLAVLGDVVRDDVGRDLLLRALVLADRGGNRSGVIVALDGLARSEADRGDLSGAIELSMLAERLDAGRQDARFFDRLAWRSAARSIDSSWVEEAERLATVADSGEIRACTAHLLVQHQGGDTAAVRAQCGVAYRDYPSDRLRRSLGELGVAVERPIVSEVMVPPVELDELLAAVDALPLLSGWQAAAPDVLATIATTEGAQ